MENIVLFAMSVIAYLFIWELCSSNYSEASLYLKRLGILALLCLPININGNVFTVAGNAVAEKSVYSVISFYQKAENGETVSIYGLGNVQIAKEEAIVTIGFPSYQMANEIGVGLGGSAVQISEKISAVLMGIAGYQKSKEETFVGTGLAGYQRAGKKASAGFTIALYQKVQDKERSFAFLSSLTSPAPEKK